MVIKYSADELIAIGEMVTLKECISRTPNQHDLEPQYHQVYVPSAQDQPTYGASASSKIPSNSISADNFLEDFAQFQHHLSQSIQFNRDIKMQLQDPSQNQEQQLSDSVAEFFKKAQQNFHPPSSIGQADSTTSTASKVRRLSDVEAELLSQLRGHIHV